jgi:hypothetical protein
VQYLLTEDEFKVRVHESEVQARDNALLAARSELLRIAKFDCIHDKDGGNMRGVCDNCPCSPLRQGHDYKTWNLVCYLRKHYSK